MYRNGLVPIGDLVAKLRCAGESIVVRGQHDVASAGAEVEARHVVILEANAWPAECGTLGLTCGEGIDPPREK